ncbi:hypothetical protein [Paenibacillus polymyxa]|uniref:hypothetical protein n=1 Tax=Paenibacillus polymyxa TaxID=1406 RepID=UPI00338E9D10
MRLQLGISAAAMAKMKIYNHTLVSLGHLAISSITPRHIQDFYNDQQKPCFVSRTAKARKKEMQVWTLEQALAFLEASKEDMYYIVLLLTLTTGVRRY